MWLKCLLLAQYAACLGQQHLIQDSHLMAKALFGKPHLISYLQRELPLEKVFDVSIQVFARRGC
jgi:hypothetical protein